MLKPLTTEFKGREITLECTHKKIFPPPQMYGSTPDDIDNLWKQGAIDQNQHQQLKVWQDKCGQMVMGPKCLDCPLALKQNPRPGRPNVIETENWLDAKRKMHWDDMKATKPAPPIVRPTRHDPPNPRDIAEKMTDNGILEEESETPPSTVPDKVALSEPEVTEEEEAPSLLDALENPDDYIEEESTEEEPVEEEPETPAVDDDDFLSSLADD